MGSTSELSLDYKPTSYPVIQKPFNEQPEPTQKLEEFLSRLEEERLKIEAFKRELPLCMQLLNNAMDAYKQQLESYKANQGETRPVIEDFIPIKQHVGADGAERDGNLQSEKANWMVSAQLWTDAAVKQQPPAEPSFGKERSGGAFLPFSKEKGNGSGSAMRVVAELALATSENEVKDEKRMEMESGGKGVEERGKSSGGNVTEGQPATATQTHRKARRCWSPDLHRRFVNALQILGGSQVATPKQIRELMKVDGLTNDEVKSHLQKYRLHTRRPVPSPQAAVPPPPHLVVLGGIWVPPEYASAAAGTAMYAAHQAAAHYCATPMPQDYYGTPTHHPNLLHRSVAAAAVSGPYKAHVRSPESDPRSGEERSESMEDGTEEGEEREEEEEEEETDDDDRSEKGAMVVAPGADVALKF